MRRIAKLFAVTALAAAMPVAAANTASAGPAELTPTEAGMIQWYILVEQVAARERALAKARIREIEQRLAANPAAPVRGFLRVISEAEEAGLTPEVRALEAELTAQVKIMWAAAERQRVAALAAKEVRRASEEARRASDEARLAAERERAAEAAFREQMYSRCSMRAYEQHVSDMDSYVVFCMRAEGYQPAAEITADNLFGKVK